MEASVRPRGHDFLWARLLCTQVRVGVDEPIHGAMDAEVLIQRPLRFYATISSKKRFGFNRIEL